MSKKVNNNYAHEIEYFEYTFINQHHTENHNSEYNLCALLLKYSEHGTGVTLSVLPNAWALLPNSVFVLT